MNLTDGMILCGRKNFDGTGGNNHAVEHYAKTSKMVLTPFGFFISFPTFLIVNSD